LWLVPEGSVEVAGRTVEVEPFYLSTLPVTNRQLAAFDPSFRRSTLSPGDEDPALGVGLELARAYCSWYARLARKAIRLPRLCEWRRAVAAEVERWAAEPRAAEEQVWHRDNSDERVPRLDDKRSNELGIYGLLGGVWEWVEEDGETSLCGGSWRMALEDLVRGPWRRASEGELLDEVGFRIAKGLRG
jgi:formylglycine-generating enzyme required for sulfatase activity